MMNINRLLHAYVSDGKGCWHWFEELETLYWKRYRCTLCNEIYYHGVDWKDVAQGFHPDYSTPDDFRVLTTKLFGDIPLYRKFEGWLFHKKYKQSHVNEIGLVDTRLFIPWLFSDYQRFCTLFAEFLQLPETVKEFGWEECECKGEPIRGDKLVWCLKCNGTGKILKPWAKMVKEDGDES